MKKIFFISLLVFIPILAFADTPFYRPIVGIPGIDETNTDFGVFINSIYALSIAIAALLAVIKIIVAGVKYMLTDVVTSKGEAKKEIEGSLLGLLIVLVAVLVLTIINSQLVTYNFDFKNMAPIEKIPPPEPLKPNEIGDNGYFSYILGDECSKEFIAEFRKDCGDYPYTFSVIDGYSRCFYNVDEELGQKMDQMRCSSIDSEERCSIKWRKAREECIGKGGQFYPDPLTEGEGKLVTVYCFYSES